MLTHRAAQARTAHTLLGTPKTPSATGGPLAGKQCADGHIVDLREVVGKIWKDHAHAIVEAWRPTQIDEMDALAWVAADAFREGPQLHPSVTNKFGKRLATRATAVKTKMTADKRTAADNVRNAQRAAASSGPLNCCTRAVHWVKTYA